MTILTTGCVSHGLENLLFMFDTGRQFIEGAYALILKIYSCFVWLADPHWPLLVSRSKPERTICAHMCLGNDLNGFMVKWFSVL